MRTRPFLLGSLGNTDVRLPIGTEYLYGVLTHRQDEPERQTGTLRGDPLKVERYGQPGAGGREVGLPSPKPDSLHASDDTKK